MQWYQSLLLLAVVASVADGARILGLFQFHGLSHQVVYEALMKGLAAKGHDVTVVSHFPQKTPLANYKDLSIKGSLPQLVNNFTIEFVRNFKLVNLFSFIWGANLDFCSVALEHPEMQKLIHSEEKFDLVVTELFGVDCCLGFAHKFNTPVIGMTSNVAVPWSHDRIGNIDNPSYIPNNFVSYGDKMSFPQRLMNTVMYVATKLGQYYFAELPTDKLLRKHFGEGLPSVSELKKRTSVVFVNSHFSLNIPRPAVPAFVEIGGIHIPPVQKLPQELEKFLQDSPNGVVYFTFGSMVKTETMSKEYIRAFLDVFRELPLRVLWKCDGAAISEKIPDNVKMEKWLPQSDILSHPKVRVFMTHGGLLSTQEAVYAGVPLVGIPLFSDQMQNINLVAKQGMAVRLDFDELNKERLQQALKTVLENPSYRENAQQLSRKFRDRPQTALETAVFWTEYVIRHGGAPHLRSAALDLTWYQYLLLDVIAVLLVAAGLLLVTLWFFTKKLLSLVLPRRETTTKPKPKTKVKSN